MHADGRRAALLCPSLREKDSARVGATPVKWDGPTSRDALAPLSNGTNQFRSAVVASRDEFTGLEFPYTTAEALECARTLSGPLPSSEASWAHVEHLFRKGDVSEPARDALRDRVLVTMDRWLSNLLPGYRRSEPRLLHAALPAGEAPDQPIAGFLHLRDNPFLRQMERQIHRACGIVPARAVQYVKGRGTEGVSQDAWQPYMPVRLRRHGEFACTRVLFVPSHDLREYASTADIPETHGGPHQSFAFLWIKSVLGSPLHVFRSPLDREKVRRGTEGLTAHQISYLEEKALKIRGVGRRIAATMAFPGSLFLWVALVPGTRPPPTVFFKGCFPVSPAGIWGDRTALTVRTCKECEDFTLANVEDPLPPPPDPPAGLDLPEGCFQCMVLLLPPGLSKDEKRIDRYSELRASPGSFDEGSMAWKLAGEHFALFAEPPLGGDRSSPEVKNNPESK